MKLPKTKKINLEQLKDTVAKTGAYLVLFVMATYGFRHLLDALPSGAAGFITGITVLALGYIVSK